VTRNADAVSCVRAIERSEHGDDSKPRDPVGASNWVSLGVFQGEQRGKRAVVISAIPSG